MNIKHKSSLQIKKQLDLKTKELIKTPQKDGERHVNPIWHKGNVYYISERDYTANIWSYNIKTKQEEQITFHKKFDVKNIDANSNRIIYEQGGFLHLLNPETKETNQINITVNPA